MYPRWLRRKEGGRGRFLKVSGDFLNMTILREIKSVHKNKRRVIAWGSVITGPLDLLVIHRS